jgi:hypothetical protein
MELGRPIRDVRATAQSTVVPRALVVRRLLLGALVPFMVTRAVLAFVGILSIAIIPLSPWAPLAWVHRGASPLVDAFARWDSQRYVRIAVDGYSATDPSSSAFFPLLPALMRALGAITGRADTAGYEIAGVVIANVALVAAVMGLMALVRLEHDRASASRVGWYLLVFPTTLFLSAAYAESLFLALSIGAVLACRTRRWAIAALLAALAALTRPFGVLVIVPLAIEAWQQRGEVQSWRSVPALLAAPAALAAYSGYLLWKVGDAFAFLHAQSGWGRSLMLPWDTFREFFSQPLTLHSGLHSTLDLCFTVVLVALTVASWRLLRHSYASYLTALVLLTLSTGSLLSIGRFAVGWFPVFMVLALAGRYRTFDRAYLVVGGGLSALFMAMFAQWYWVS